ILRGNLRRVRRRLARSLEAHGTGRRPRDRVALRVGDGDHRVVEARVHVGHARSDVLLLAATNPRLVLGHVLIPLLQTDAGRSESSAAFLGLLTFSCRQLVWPALYAYAHWCGSADRAPVIRGDGASPDSSRGPHTDVGSGPLRAVDRLRPHIRVRPPRKPD